MIKRKHQNIKVYECQCHIVENTMRPRDSRVRRFMTHRLAGFKLECAAISARYKRTPHHGPALL